MELINQVQSNLEMFFISEHGSEIGITQFDLGEDFINYFVNFSEESFK